MLKQGVHDKQSKRLGYERCNSQKHANRLLRVWQMTWPITIAIIPLNAIPTAPLWNFPICHPPIFDSLVLSNLEPHLCTRNRKSHSLLMRVIFVETTDSQEPSRHHHSFPKDTHPRQLLLVFSTLDVTRGLELKWDLQSFDTKIEPTPHDSNPSTAAAFFSDNSHTLTFGLQLLVGIWLARSRDFVRRMHQQRRYRWDCLQYSYEWHDPTQTKFREHVGKITSAGDFDNALPSFHTESSNVLRQFEGPRTSLPKRSMSPLAASLKNVQSHHNILMYTLLTESLCL